MEPETSCKWREPGNEASSQTSLMELYIGMYACRCVLLCRDIKSAILHMPIIRGHANVNNASVNTARFGVTLSALNGIFISSAHS